MRIELAFTTVLLAASQAWAGTIAIQITHRAELQEGQLKAELSVTNAGDEAAHGVTPALRFRDAESRAETKDTLPPDEPLEASLAVPAAGIAEGRWPYRIAVDYADANLYPFQALSVGMLVVGSPPLPKVSLAEIPGATLASEGELPVKVKNVSGSPQRVRVEIVAPEAIEVGPLDGETELAAWEEREIPVPLTNRAALPGSRYPLFVTVEYQDGDVHQTVIGQTVVEVRPADALVGPGGRYLWVAAAVFGVLFAGLLLFRGLRRGTR